MQAKLLLYKYMFPLWRAPSCIGCNASAAHDGRKVEDMSEKKLAASAAAQTPEAHDTEPKAKKPAKSAARRGRPPLTPELYVELGDKQYNVSDIVERAKADYRATHKVGVQSCKVYLKPEEGAAYYVVNKVSGKLDL